MKTFSLKNKAAAVYKQNKNTPRVGFTFNFLINEPESSPGIYCLMSRLLLQGTTTFSSEELSKQLDENAIELSCDIKQDYLRFNFVCLNEDFELAIKILADIIKNSTFEEFEKEKTKLNGEIIAELDSAKAKALDNYYKTIFKNHYYGNTLSKILENIDNITKSDITNAYKKLLDKSKKVLSFVGDIEYKKVLSILNSNLSDISISVNSDDLISTPELAEQRTVETIKNDAQQAQIFQGWLVPTFDSKDHAALIVLNTILGAAGLSSRLFQELREKKGLAYTVRSAYETNGHCGNFSIYIGTEPKNIKTSIDGFNTEIQKLKDTDVTQTEINNAINNILGKRQFVTETNFQQANLLAYYGVMGLGFEYQDKIIDLIRSVTPKQIKDCTNKYFTDKYVISILKPNL